MALKANLIIDQGTDFLTEINVTDDDSNPIDLSDYTGQAQMRKHYTSATYFSFNVIANNANGTVTLTLAANISNTIPAGRYVYDCELTDTTNSKTSRLVEGIVTITPQVTK